MCEQSQGVLNLYRFAEMEAGMEEIGQEPLVGSGEVIDKMMEEYECDCADYPSRAYHTVTLTWHNG